MVKISLLLSAVALCAFGRAVAGIPDWPDGRHLPERIETTRLTRIIEANRTSDGSYNVASKSDEGRLLFGDFNARVEYLLEPSFSASLGCRIYRGATDTAYVLEVERVANYKEVEEQLQKEFPIVGTSVTDFAGLSAQEQQTRLAHNRKMWRAMAAERLKRYRIEAHSLPIADRLADRLYAATREGIRSVVPEKKRYTEDGNEMITVIRDGDVATFRCVVDDAVWTLRYHAPEGEAKALSELFQTMIADVVAGTFDEAKYLDALE